MLARAPRSARLGDARTLPYGDASFASVAELYVLHHLADPRPALTFDAEIAPELLGELFAHVEVERWDAPMLTLPTAHSVRDYLLGEGVDAGRAEAWASASDAPLTVTKRGALAFARKA